MSVKSRLERLAKLETLTLPTENKDGPKPSALRSCLPIGTPNRIARLLKGFGIEPKNINQGDKRPKGYEVESFADVFSRYLPNRSSATFNDSALQGNELQSSGSVAVADSNRYSTVNSQPADEKVAVSNRYLSQTATYYNSIKGRELDWESSGVAVQTGVQEEKKSHVAGSSSFPDWPAVAPQEEVQELNLPPLKWIVEGLIPSGFTLLAAPSKTGKSFFALQLLVSVAQGKPFLDMETKACHALYLCLESGPRGLQSRLSHLQTDGLEKLNVVYDLRNIPPLEYIQAFKEENPDCELVVVDIMARARPPQPNGPNYSTEYIELSEWRELAEEFDIAILGITHTRKSLSETGDFTDEFYGSGAISGAPNGLIQIRRARNSPDAVLKATYRDSRDLELALSFNDCVWTATGANPALASQTQERKEIVKAISDKGGQAKTGEIAKALGKSTKDVSMLLQKLKEQGLIVSTEYGKYSLKTPIGTIGSIGTPDGTTQGSSNGSITSNGTLDGIDY